MPRKGCRCPQELSWGPKTGNKEVKPLLLELTVQLIAGRQKSHSKDPDTQMKSLSVPAEPKGHVQSESELELGDLGWIFFDLSYMLKFL